MDNTVLKATLLCVWKGELYCITMAFFYFMFGSILFLLFCFCTVRDYHVCCCCCCCYTVQYWCVCCCCCCCVRYEIVAFVVIINHHLRRRLLCFCVRCCCCWCCWCCRCRWCCSYAFVAVAVAIIVPYRGIDSIRFDSFLFHGSFAVTVIK